LFSRTKALLDEFGKALSCADEILLAPIYAAREAHNPSVSSELLAQKVHVPVKAFPSLKEVANYSLHMYKNKEVFVTMGAGDIYEVGNTILQKQSFGHF
jgi:UDP-N-acetylmuramate--alanine ligase